MSLIEIPPCNNASDVLERAKRVAERRAKALRPPKQPVAIPPSPVEPASIREVIPVAKARVLYDELGNWRKVAAIIRRENGQRWDPVSIGRAVRRDDLARAPIAPSSDHLSMKYIIVVTAEYFGLSVTEMLARSREPRFVVPRQIAMSLSRKLTIHSWAEIGNRFGHRTDKTVIHAFNRISKMIDAGDADVLDAIAEIKRRLTA